MKTVFVAALILMFLSALWGPTCLVARRLALKGDALAFRPLRVILPVQVISVLVLTFTADAIGLRNPAGLLAAIVSGVSLSGAAALFFCRAFNFQIR